MHCRKACVKACVSVICVCVRARACAHYASTVWVRLRVWHVFRHVLAHVSVRARVRVCVCVFVGGGGGVRVYVWARACACVCVCVCVCTRAHAQNLCRWWWSDTSYKTLFCVKLQRRPGSSKLVNWHGLNQHAVGPWIKRRYLPQSSKSLLIILLSTNTPGGTLEAKKKKKKKRKEDKNDSFPLSLLFSFFLFSR